MDGQDFQSGANGTDRLPTLRDLATPLFRHPKLVLLTFLGLLLATLVGVILLPNDYEAKMKILVNRDRVDQAVSPGRDAVVSNPGGVTEEELNSEVELLKSRDLLEKVIVACNLQELPYGPFWNRLLPAAATGERGDGQESGKQLYPAVVGLEE